MKIEKYKRIFYRGKEKAEIAQTTLKPILSPVLQSAGLTRPASYRIAANVTALRPARFVCYDRSDSDVRERELECRSDWTP